MTESDITPLANPPSSASGRGSSLPPILPVLGTFGADTLLGGERPEVFFGQSGNDRILGGSANDLIAGGRGDDALDGGGGLDTAAYGGERADFVLYINGTTATLRDTVGQEGTDTLAAVERLLFADMRIALDLQGHAGIAVKLIGAVAGKEAIGNRGLVGTSLSLLEQGLDAQEVAALLIGSTCANLSDQAFVSRVYENVTGQAPSAAELEHYMGLLSSGAHTQASLAVLASQTAELALRIDLVGLSLTGVEFAPPA